MPPDPGQASRPSRFWQDTNHPRPALVSLVAQQVGRVVCHDQRRAVIRQTLPPKLAERDFGLEQAVGGVASERHDKTRLDQFDLAQEIRLALDHFFRLRIPIAGGATF